MGFIDWQDAMSVNVPELDNQHKKLVQLVNQLHDAMKSGKGRDVLAPILQNVVRYTQVHFRAEEAYMQRTGYADLEAHKKKHHALEEKAAELLQRVQSGDTMVTLEVMDFLKTWLKNHIMNVDKQYAPVGQTC